MKLWSLQQILIRQAVQLFTYSQTAIMDYVKVYDSQLPHTNNSLLLQFLDRKRKSRSTQAVSVYTEDIEVEQNKPSKLTPGFTFSFTSYEIRNHVQYNVVLCENYKILGRNIINKYRFKTRYSMLEVLDAKLGGMGLPGKKIFGNKNPQFIERRKAELEGYLNRLARNVKPEFIKFVKQIKDNEFNLSLNQKFSIE